GGRPQRVYMFWHLVGNRFLSMLTNILYNTTVSDMETGYKAFRTEILRSLDLRQNDFGIEPEITAKICKRKLRVYELPIAYYGRESSTRSTSRRAPGARSSPGAPSSGPMPRSTFCLRSRSTRRITSFTIVSDENGRAARRKRADARGRPRHAASARRCALLAP